MSRSKRQRKKPQCTLHFHEPSTPVPIHLIASQIDWICLSATRPSSLALCAPFQNLVQVLCALLSNPSFTCAVPRTLKRPSINSCIGGERAF
ncbi:hypothetical protein ACKLNR_012129 [Fusarium oxysporum f. sp. zingiberi]